MENDIGSFGGSVSADAGNTGNTIDAGVGSGGSDTSMSFSNDVAIALELEMENQSSPSLADAIAQAAVLGHPFVFSTVVSSTAIYDTYGGYVGMGIPVPQDYYAMMGINNGGGYG